MNNKCEELEQKRKRIEKKIKKIEKRLAIFNFFVEERRHGGSHGTTIAGIIAIISSLIACFFTGLPAILLVIGGFSFIAISLLMHFDLFSIEDKLLDKVQINKQMLTNITEEIDFLKNGVLPKTEEEKQKEKEVKNIYSKTLKEIKAEIKSRQLKKNLLNELVKRKNLEQRAERTIDEIKNEFPDLALSLQEELEKMNSIKLD